MDQHLGSSNIIQRHPGEEKHNKVQGLTLCRSASSPLSRPEANLPCGSGSGSHLHYQSIHLLNNSLDAGRTESCWYISSKCYNNQWFVPFGTVFNVFAMSRQLEEGFIDKRGTHTSPEWQINPILNGRTSRFLVIYTAWVIFAAYSPGLSFSVKWLSGS